MARPKVRLHTHGVVVRGAEVRPLRSGAMHYWRLDPSDWARALDSMAALGYRFVDTYVPWAVHETSPRVYDFGTHDARRDLPRFLKLAHERDLCVILRPGPHINAELTHFGLPERVVWNDAFQARTAKGNPVILPMIPLAFPVPSYASDGFMAEVEHWFSAVGEVASSLRAPEGPIALVQVDNEAAFYFRDGPYDQDYHPDAVRLFRGFLRKKYPKLIDFRAAWEDRRVGFQDAEPPREFDAKTVSKATPHLDWMEFQEHLLGTALERMTQALDHAGLGGLPTVHNFPPGEAATALNAASLTSIDLVGLDYYHRASPNEHLAIFRRTTELASRCEGKGVPAFAVEMGAGSPPFMGPFDEDDSIYVWLTALAYGLVGYNAYMAVDRDRWVGAPIDPRGNIRPFGERVRKIHEALDRLSFHTLRRQVPVKLIVPRSLRRLARATHAFGPLSPALFNVLGGGFAESCFEDHLGLGKSVVLEAERFLRVFEQALFARGVPFGYAGGESLAEASAVAKWLVVPTAAGLQPDLWAQLRSIRASGRAVTIGPTILDRGGSERTPKRKLDVRTFDIASLEDPNEVATVVARRIEALKLPAYTATQGAYVTVHHDKKAPRAVVLMNPRRDEIVSSVSVMKVDQLRDALTGRTIKRSFGSFEISLPPRSVRLFAVATLVSAMVAASCSGSGLRDDGRLPPDAADAADATVVDNRLRCGPEPYVLAKIHVTTTSGAALGGVAFSSPFCPGVTQLSNESGDIDGYVTKDVPFYARFDADSYAPVLSSEQRFTSDSRIVFPMLPRFITGILPGYDTTRGAVLISLNRDAKAPKPCADLDGVRITVKDVPSARVVYFAEGVVPAPIEGATATSKAGLVAIVDLDLGDPVTVLGKKKGCVVSFTSNGATGRAPLEGGRITLMAGAVLTPPPSDAGANHEAGDARADDADASEVDAGSADAADAAADAGADAVVMEVDGSLDGSAD